MPKKPPIPHGQSPSPHRRQRSKVNSPVATTTRTLQALSRAVNRSTEDLRTAFIEAATGSDRSACIIIASMLQRSLEQTILLRLLIYDKDKITPLFERDGALSSFFGLIHLAFALDMITGTVRDDMDTIRRVRNAFAHAALPITFQSKEIKRELNKLQHRTYSASNVADDIMGNETPFSPERRELITCCLKIMGVLTDAAEIFVLQQQKLITFWNDAQRAS